MGLKKSKDYGKKIADRKEPLASMKRLVKACRQAEAEDKELLNENHFSAGEILFGCAIQDGVHHKTKAAELLDAFLKEMTDGGYFEDQRASTTPSTKTKKASQDGKEALGK